MNKQKISWEELEKFVDNLIRLHGEHNFTGVYGLPRGGLVPAVMFSNRTGIPMLIAPCEGCLIVDDIADSGKSLIHYTKNDTQFNKYFIATMYYQNRSIVTPDYYWAEKGDLWLCFPWE